MEQTFGVQVVKTTKAFKLVSVTPELRTLDIRSETPPRGYTQTVWNEIRRRGMSQVKNWLASEEQGFGILVYEGRHYEFDEPCKVKLESWPEEPREALRWLKWELGSKFFN